MAESERSGGERAQVGVETSGLDALDVIPRRAVPNPQLSANLMNRDPHADQEATRRGADPGAATDHAGTTPPAVTDRACQQPCQVVSYREGPDPPVAGGHPGGRGGNLLCPPQRPSASHARATNAGIGINASAWCACGMP